MTAGRLWNRFLSRPAQGEAAYQARFRAIFSAVLVLLRTTVFRLVRA